MGGAAGAGRASHCAGSQVKALQMDGAPSSQVAGERAAQGVLKLAGKYTADDVMCFREGEGQGYRRLT